MRTPKQVFEKGPTLLSVLIQETKRKYSEYDYVNLLFFQEPKIVPANIVEDEEDWKTTQKAKFPTILNAYDDKDLEINKLELGNVQQHRSCSSFIILDEVKLRQKYGTEIFEKCL